MEKEEQKQEVEEQQEEETTLTLRKSRNESKTTETVEQSNGVSESNGHEIHSELFENGAQNEELVAPENEHKSEKLNGVHENGSEDVNGEQKQQNLVFHDDVEGIWKCRLCPWTYRNGSFCVDHTQNHKGQLHRLMTLKLLNFEYKGDESESTYFGEKQILEDPRPQKFDISYLDFIVQNHSTPATEIENSSVSSSNLKPSQLSFQEDITSYESSKEIESAEVDVINGDDLEVTEEDVERVIHKQTTHDLYCPNCNSCITKRVILSKRKRKVRVSDEEVKRNRIETALDSKLGTGLVQSPSNQDDYDDAQITREGKDERERGPFIFRCLSCFSFFVPTEDGCFRIFGDKGGKDRVRDQQAPKKNWFTFMFTKQETTVVDQGSRDAVISSSNLSDQSGQPSLSQKTRTPTQEGEDKISPFPNQKPSINGNVAVGVGVGSADAVLPSSHLSGQKTRTPTQEGENKDAKATETVDATMEMFDSYTTDHKSGSKSSQVVNGNCERDLSVTTVHTRTQETNGKSTEDAFSFSQEDGLKSLISENNGFFTLEKPDDVHLSKQTVQQGAADKEVFQLTPSTDKDSKLNFSVFIPHQEQDVRTTILTDSVLENTSTGFSRSDSGHFHYTEISQHITTKTDIEVHSSKPLKVGNISPPNNAAIVQDKDTVITIDRQPADSSQTPQDEIRPSGTALVSQVVSGSRVSDSQRTEVRKEYEIEVVKSIVYGGLAESITSLSVVSSAVGGGAATLNVLALGAANLIGGLFIIFHNLWDLKCDGAEQVSNQIVEQRDRYKQLLGRRQNFILHAVVAVISYIIFGLVPPIIYGFSFRESDDKQLKLVVVGAASLVCILTLAIAKAYTQCPPKPYLKTVTTYVIMGFMVSGVSYAAGGLVERVLNELSVFKTTPVSNIAVPEMRPTGSGWGSY